jgi:hypothetical protein
VVGAIVVMNDRVQRRVEACGLDIEVVRLRQPIDYNRFRPHHEPARQPRRAVLIGNYLTGKRRELVASTLEDMGVEWTQIGRQGEVTTDPSTALGEADIVVGFGRSILEGMSSGCAAYVYEVAVDGWVTPDSYPAMETDGFAGTAFDGASDAARVERDLRAYDPRMGTINRELIGKHHDPFQHANELAALLGRLAPRHTPAEPRTELARLVRLQWESEVRAMHFQTELIKTTQRLIISEETLAEFRGSLRYRLARWLGAPIDWLRTRRRG